ncbi:MAG: membrane protein insertion efficiency factor YidD [Lentisphaeraceae bacterium]|nr:membrane protein insertion efficiency factor YidD [Lentisphaeraceae bacterium]
MRFLKKVCQIPSKISLGVIWFYKTFISPLSPPTCRFHPTCSSYSAEAIKRHGFLKGSWLTITRILRCQPFYKGNFYDPVPPCKHDDTDLNG